MSPARCHCGIHARAVFGQTLHGLTAE
jgi:hypothetical protein